MKGDFDGPVKISDRERQENKKRMIATFPKVHSKRL